MNTKSKLRAYLLINLFNSGMNCFVSFTLYLLDITAASVAEEPNIHATIMRAIVPKG